MVPVIANATAQSNTSNINQTNPRTLPEFLGSMTVGFGSVIEQFD